MSGISGMLRMSVEKERHQDIKRHQVLYIFGMAILGMVGEFENVGNVRNIENVRRDRQTPRVIHFLNHKLKVI